MNKKIREATKEEIRDIYNSNILKRLQDVRYRSKNGYYDMRTGEILNRAGFTLRQAEKINRGLEFRCLISKKDRRYRLKKRISKMVGSGNAKFLTLTFNDNFLSRETSQETRRRYIRRFLKEQCSEYVANLDFGEREDKTHREHYHAIVVPKGDKIDYAPYCDFFDGSRIYSENIASNEKSNISLSLYINKLTNHSLKASGQYKRLIYSR